MKNTTANTSVKKKRSEIGNLKFTNPCEVYRLDKELLRGNAIL